MEQQLQQQIAALEAKTRQMTGIVLGMVAFVATYALMAIQGSFLQPSSHVFPWMLGVLFYFAGQLLALIWFRTFVTQLRSLIEFAQVVEQKRMLLEREAITQELAEDGDVEIIRPGGEVG